MLKASPDPNALDDNAWFMPGESALHLCAWAAFVTSYDIWKQKQIPDVQRSLVHITYGKHIG